MEDEKKQEEIVQEHEQEQEEKPTTMGGLKSIGFGIILFAVAYYFYITMTSYENGEGIRMNRILLLAYEIVGKNITAGILVLIGLFIAGGGVKEVAEAQKA
ncbi:MAG: hypothetical protein AAF990_15895 [Bacteroidota bacterium]